MDNDKHNPKQAKRMIKKLTKQLKFEPQEFNLIISGQPFKFKFNEPLTSGADLSYQEDETWVPGIDLRESGPDHTRYIIEKPQRESRSKIADLIKYFWWKDEKHKNI